MKKILNFFGACLLGAVLGLMFSYALLGAFK
jgi:hypothetical protein